MTEPENPFCGSADLVASPDCAEVASGWAPADRVLPEDDGAALHAARVRTTAAAKASRMFRMSDC